MKPKPTKTTPTVSRYTVRMEHTRNVSSQLDWMDWLGIVTLLFAKDSLMDIVVQQCCAGCGWCKNRLKPKVKCDRPERLIVTMPSHIWVPASKTKLHLQETRGGAKFTDCKQTCGHCLAWYERKLQQQVDNYVEEVVSRLHDELIGEA